jgi:hypothetical protein
VDGGFATFDPRTRTDSWGVSHPDVTPVVIRALLSRLPLVHSAVRRGITYVLSQIQSNGLWRSFWWKTSLYSTIANISLLEQTHTAYNRARVIESVRTILDSRDPFQTALLGDILTMLDRGNPRIAKIGDVLAELQRPDGRWHTSSPILRITATNCFDPWIPGASVGQTVLEPHYIFTTSTVLRCLSKMHRQLTYQ